MFKTQVLRQAARAFARPAAIARPRQWPTTPSTSTCRNLTTTVFRRNPSDNHDAATTSAAPGESGDQEGQFARTNPDIQVEYPAESQFPESAPVQGRGGEHNMRTLATFSLEGKVAVITGGARGLGLVMTQALVISGADVAIVDLNSRLFSQRPDAPLLTTTVEEEGERQADLLLQSFKSENPGATKFVSLHLW